MAETPHRTFQGRDEAAVRVGQAVLGHFASVGQNVGDAEFRQVVSDVMRAIPAAALKDASGSSSSLTAIVAQYAQPVLLAATQPSNLHGASRGSARSPDADAQAAFSRGQWIGGQWVHGEAAGAAARAASSSSRPGYGTLTASSSCTLQGVTSANFAATPFAAAGVNFETLSYLRNVDRSFTAQNVIQAAADARLLGFVPSDRGMMRSLATIERYDNRPKATVKALHQHGQLQDKDKEALKLLLQRQKDAATPEARAEAHKDVEAFWKARRRETGVQGRIEDRQNHPKARTETERAAKKVEKKVEEKVRAAPSQSLTSGADRGSMTPDAKAKSAAIFSALKKGAAQKFKPE